MKKLNVERSPCTSCPYRKDVPSGVWHFDEYEKLREYDNVEIHADGSVQGALMPFLCHHTFDMPMETVCRGWLTVHQESVAVRLAVLKGAVTVEEVYAEVPEKLYATGNEAADFGQKKIEQPSRKARTVISRLLRNKKRRT